MTMLYVAAIRCDGCGDKKIGSEAGTKARLQATRARIAARKDGWETTAKRSKNLDFCPECLGKEEGNGDNRTD